MRARPVQREQSLRADRHNVRLTNPAALRSIQYGLRSYLPHLIRPPPTAERAAPDRLARAPYERVPRNTTNVVMTDQSQRSEESE